MPEDIDDPNRLRSRVLMEALDSWRRIKRDDVVPSRQNFLPEEHPHLWPYIALLDVLDEGGDYRIRYFGVKLVQAFGEYTGRLLSEIERDVGAPLAARALFEHCVERARPSYLYVSSSRKTRDKSIVEKQGLALPLRREGDGVAQLIAAMVHEPEETAP